MRNENLRATKLFAYLAIESRFFGRFGRISIKRHCSQDADIQSDQSLGHENEWHTLLLENLKKLFQSKVKQRGDSVPCFCIVKSCYFGNNSHRKITKLTQKHYSYEKEDRFIS